MTIDSLSNLANCAEGGASTLLVARQSGKDWNYTLQTLASNLINDPIINRTTLGSATHPFKSATVETLNVTGGAVVAGSVTVTSSSTSTTALTISDTLTVTGSTEITGNLSTKDLNATEKVECTTLYGVDISGQLNQTTRIPKVEATSSLTASAINTSSLTATSLYGDNVSKDGKEGKITTVIVEGDKGTLTSPNIYASTSVNATTLNAKDITASAGTIQTDYLYGSNSSTPIGTINVANSLSLNNLTASSATLTVNKSTSISTGVLSDLNTISLASTLTAKSLTLSTGELKVTSTGTVTVGNASSTTKMSVDSSGNTTVNGTLKVTDPTPVTRASSSGALSVTGGIYCGDNILVGGKVYNAVWNDLADCIPVDKEAVIEPGYCYCFDGEKYYKSTKYLEKGIIGIESDTYGMHMGSKPGTKQMDVAISGFVLAYVDKEYESGTPLTCTENGYLTEIAKQDKIEYPERIVGTYWKPETEEYWGSRNNKVKVKGRHWVRIK